MLGSKLGELKNGAPVFDRVTSHLHTEYENINHCLSEVLPTLTPDSDFYEYTHYFENSIGESICVSTDDTDDIVYAQRVHRGGHTRFVRGRTPLPTNAFTVVLKRDRKSQFEQYILMTAYIGEKAPAEPWAKTVHEDSLEFWSTHALIWGAVPLVPGTETSECPW